MKKTFFILVILFTVFSKNYAQRLVKVGAFNLYPGIFMDTDGQVKGFYVDALSELGKKENIQFVYVYGSWSEGLERLENEEIDMLTSVAFTESRSRFMDYTSVPLLTVWGEVYLHSNSEINGILDLQNKKVAMMQGDVNGKHLRDLTAKLNINYQLIEVNDFDEVFRLVSGKHADAGVVNNTFGSPKQREYDLRSSGIVLNPFDIFITVKKDKNRELLVLVDTYLHNWKHDPNSVFNLARQKWSHENIGLVEVIPAWFQKVLYLGILTFVLLIVFISLLRYKVKLATEKIEASKNNWQTTFDAINDIVMLLSKKHEIIEINKAGVLALKLDKKDIIGKECFQLVHNTPGPIGACPCESALKEKKATIKEYEEGGQVYLLTAYPVFNEKGEIEHFTHIIKDITEAKHSENEMYRQKKLFETMFNTIEEGVVITNTKREVVLANQGMLKTFGYQPQELIGKQTKMFYDTGIYEDLGKKLFNKEAEKTEERYITFYKDKKNRVFPGETFGSKLYDNNGQWIGNIGIMRDVSERVKFIEALQQAKEKAEESDRLKSAFLANMSHEIRTPMNAIRGFAQLLVESSFSKEKQNRFLNIINSRSMDLLVIIDDIIDISKIEANQLKIIDSDFCVNKLLQEVYSNKETEMQNDINTNLKIQLKTGLPDNQAFITSDENRLKQVLLNLLNNAIKFTEKGIIEFGYFLNHSSELEFYVKDTGIGVPLDAQKIIFERFRQVDESNTRKYGGTGLGLPICKQILKLLGGDIWVDSEEGKGAKFSFTLPYKLVTKQDHAPDEYTECHWDNQKVLIVEDDSVNLYYLYELLEPTKIKILKAYDGQTALELLNKDEDVDLVLLDINLPGMDGNEVIKQIRKINKSIPVVAQSAYSMHEEINKSMSYGFSDYITKPIDSRILFLTMNKYLSK